MNDASPSALRPKVGTGVIVVHALGAGAVPADLESSGFEVIVSTESNEALVAISAGQANIALVDGRFEGNGLAFCERLWGEHPGFPVLLIGAE